ncbi:hypothetical protein RRG08_050283 [Elysia crispata]|uniref:Uncharacterized protein n=1 Tax=Elysia crispata TaxID=231223 RepID=A0AAE1B3U8_9GAST|nr:hypothetical protein RRG08_050283 [Elysia crispata]
MVFERSACGQLVDLTIVMSFTYAEQDTPRNTRYIVLNAPLDRSQGFTITLAAPQGLLWASVNPVIRTYNHQTGENDPARDQSIPDVEICAVTAQNCKVPEEHFGGDRIYTHIRRQI